MRLCQGPCEGQDSFSSGRGCAVTDCSCSLFPGSTCTHLCSVSGGSLSSDALVSLDSVTGESPDRGSDDHLAELESDDIRTSTNEEKQSDGGRSERNRSAEMSSELCSGFEKIKSVTHF